MGRLQGQPARNANVKEQEKPSDEGNHRLGPSNRNGTLGTLYKMSVSG